MPVEIRKWWINRKNKDAPKTQQQKNSSDNMIPIPEVLRKRPK